MSNPKRTRSEIRDAIKKTKMKKFEYKVIYGLSIPFEDTLNELGLEGWELISANHNTGSNTHTGMAILKREIL